MGEARKDAKKENGLGELLSFWDEKLPASVEEVLLSAEFGGGNEAREISNRKKPYGRMELASEGYRFVIGHQRDSSEKIIKRVWYAVLVHNGKYTICRQVNRTELDDSQFELIYHGDGKRLEPHLKRLLGIK